MVVDVGGKLYMIMEISHVFDQINKEHLDGVHPVSEESLKTEFPTFPRGKWAEIKTSLKIKILDGHHGSIMNASNHDVVIIWVSVDNTDYPYKRGTCNPPEKEVMNITVEKTNHVS